MSFYQEVKCDGKDKFHGFHVVAYCTLVISFNYALCINMIQCLCHFVVVNIPLPVDDFKVSETMNFIVNIL